MTFKTIKKLEFKTKDYYDVGYLKALKDVIKLIMDDESIPDLVKTTLKSKINGK